MKHIFLLVTLFMVNIGVAQVGIGIERPEADLDVNVKMQLSNLPNVSTQLDKYNRIIYADGYGNLGYMERSADSYVYGTSYFQTMSNPVSVGTTLTPLNLSLTIVILPMKKMIVEINYNIVVINGGTGLGSILLGKNESNSVELIYNSMRSFSFASNYSTRASAQGRSISNVYYDELENNTNQVKYVTYNVYGVLSQPRTPSSNTAYNLFGMWTRPGEPKNLNWGKGSLNINVYDY